MDQAGTPASGRHIGWHTRGYLPHLDLPDLKASLAKTPDGRWIVATSSGDLSYIYEQSEDRRAFKPVSTKWRGREAGTRDPQRK